MEKLEWCGYPIVKKLDDVFMRFDTIRACDGQRDGQTASCDIIVLIPTPIAAARAGASANEAMPLAVDNCFPIPFSIVTMVVYHFRVKARYWSINHTPFAFDGPVSGAAVRGSSGNIGIAFGVEKTRIVWLPDGEK